MIDNARLNELRQGPDIRYSRYRASICDIYILGNDHSLKALVYRNSGQDTTPIERLFTEGAPDSIRKAGSLLDIYFSAFKSPQQGRVKIKAAEVNIDKSTLQVTLFGMTLTLDLTPFTRAEIAVYRELLKILPGETISYGHLAERAGIHRGARFAGNAMAKNSFPIIIPCHRVIKSDGSMGNYSGGIDKKKYLLSLEQGRSL